LISETFDLIGKISKKLKDISSQDAETLKNLKETAKMIKDFNYFAKTSELIKDYENSKKNN